MWPSHQLNLASAIPEVLNTSKEGNSRSRASPKAAASNLVIMHVSQVPRLLLAANSTHVLVITKQDQKVEQFGNSISKEMVDGPQQQTNDRVAFHLLSEKLSERPAAALSSSMLMTDLKPVSHNS